VNERQKKYSRIVEFIIFKWEKIIVYRHIFLREITVYLALKYSPNYFINNRSGFIRFINNLQYQIGIIVNAGSGTACVDRSAARF